jgi:hypothetical protein
MADGNGNGDGDGNCNGVGVRDGDGDSNRSSNGHGKGNNDKGRVASSCAGNVQRCGWGDTFHGHKGKCIHQCCIMGVTLLRMFAPFQRGGFLTAQHGVFFCLFFTTTVQFTEQPSVCSPHYSGAQEPCQPYLLHLSKNPISLLTIYPRSYCTFCQGKPGQGLQ